MPAFLSPLRYPGGKAKLGNFIGRIIERNLSGRTVYIEPFSGGAGVALHLLFHEFVHRIVLNDLDRGIASFWRCVFHRTDDLIDLVLSCDLSVKEWMRQNEIYANRCSAGELELGFATLYLNRTNRSGILNARPIGGLNQTGPWKMDARFNRVELSNRIRRLGGYRNRVLVTNIDALQLLSALDSVVETGQPFIYVDPPYLAKGWDLYLNAVSMDGHRSIAEILRKSGKHWVVTYDNHVAVPEFYPSERKALYRLNHTAAKQHFGTEYIVFSDTLAVDCLQAVGPHGAHWVN